MGVSSQVASALCLFAIEFKYVVALSAHLTFSREMCGGFFYILIKGILSEVNVRVPSDNSYYKRTGITLLLAI